MAKALFVIDMQEVTVGKNHSAMFSYPDVIVQKVNSVIGENEGRISSTIAARWSEVFMMTVSW